jgi:predicted nucleotidyltransferase
LSSIDLLVEVEEGCSEVFSSVELKDQASSWCSSLPKPVDAEKPTATVCGNSRLRSTVVLTWYKVSSIWRSTASSFVRLS